MTKSILASMALILLLTGSLSAMAAEPVLPERSIGKADAPITIDEYASPTCSHCGDFYIKTLPEIEKKYIETGKVRFVFHDFPLNAIDLKASSLAHCMPADKFFPFVNVLYKNIEQWAIGKNPEQTLLQYATLMGLNEDKAKACLKDDKMVDALVAERTDATEKYDVKSTPTFIINKGQEKIEGARSVQDFSAIFDRLLAPKK